MQNTLSKIIAQKQLEIAHNKIALPLTGLKIQKGNGSFLKSLQKPGLNIIAEIKPKSPSAGILGDGFRLEKILPIYNKYASALSILTDTEFFGGSFELLSTVTKQSKLPAMCKDFILDQYQCYLARSCGAQAVLLIVKILSNEDLKQLYAQVKELGMTVVLEIQNEVELKRVNSMNLQPEVVLINNRNLEDFKIDLNTTNRLAPLIGEKAIVVSASGIESKEDIENLKPFCSNFLVGALFMRSSNPEKEFQDLVDTMPPVSSAKTSR